MKQGFIRLKANAATGHIGFNGETFDIVDGFVDVPVAAVEVFTNQHHGLAVINPQPEVELEEAPPGADAGNGQADPFADMTKAQITEEILKINPEAVTKGLNKEALIAMLQEIAPKGNDEKKEGDEG